MPEQQSPSRPQIDLPRPPRAVRWVVDLESHRIVPVEELQSDAKRS